MFFSQAAIDFRVGDRVIALYDSFLGDMYQEGDIGIVVQIQNGGLIIARERGGLIGAPGKPMECSPENWEVA